VFPTQQKLVSGMTRDDMNMQMKYRLPSGSTTTGDQVELVIAVIISSQLGGHSDHLTSNLGVFRGVNHMLQRDYQLVTFSHGPNRSEGDNPTIAYIEFARGNVLPTENAIVHGVTNSTTLVGTIR
jgi:hypothetical protein